MSKTRWNRRQFMQSAASASMALPMLPSLLPRSAHAQSIEIPTRVILIQMRDGTFPSEFWPQRDPTSTLGDGVFGYPLSSIDGPISNVMGPAWDPVRSKVSVVRGLGYLHYAFHKVCSPYSSAAMQGDGETGPPQAGSSIDCILENSPRFMAQNARPPSMRIAGNRAFSFWRPNGGTSAVERISGITGDQAVFNTFFNGFSGGSTIEITPEETHEATVMDRARARFNRLLASPRISDADKQNLTRHADAIQELQQRIEANQMAPEEVTVCQAPELGFGGNARTTYENYMDTVANAFACDLSRIATLYMIRYDDNGSVGPSQHHDNSHKSNSDPVARADCRAWQGWIMDRVAYLLRALDAIPQPDGKTLLDHSIVVFANEDGHGNLHSSEGLPCVVAGGANGRLKMGDYIDFRERPFRYPRDNTAYPELGLPWPGLLLSVMAAAGLDSRDWAHQGDEGRFGQAKHHFPGNYGTSTANTYRSNPLPYFYRG
ncbi:MAG: DUF1552 domain-containing protein [Myxococcota bacterium]